MIEITPKAFNFLFKECPNKYVWKYPKLGAGLIFSFVMIYILILVPYRFGNFGFMRTVIFSFYCSIISGGIYYTWHKMIKTNYKRTYYVIDDLLWINVILSLISLGIYLFGKINNTGIFFFLKEKTEFFTIFNSFFYTYSVGFVIYIFLFFFDYFFDNNRLNNHNSIFNDKRVINDIYPCLSNISNEIISTKNSSPLILFDKEEQNSSIKVENNSRDDSTKARIMLIEGKNSNECLKMKPDNFIYIKASGNYLDVCYYDEHHKIKKDTIRNSIAEVLQQIAEYSCIIQIHRSYVVNMKYVKTIKGTVKNTKLKIQKTTRVIEFPVSRARVASVKSKYDEYYTSILKETV